MAPSSICHRLTSDGSPFKNQRADRSTFGRARTRSSMDKVKYEVTDDKIVFVVDVEGFGFAKVTSARKGGFSCRVTDRAVLAAALEAAGALAAAHESELPCHCTDIAKSCGAPTV